MNIALVAALVAALNTTSILNTASMTMSDKVTIAIENPSKVAEVMPTAPVEQERFKAALLNAIKTMPASPEEKKQKFIAVRKAVIACAAPESMAGVLKHDFQTSVTNSTSSLELDMDYGLWRKPKTMDKNKRYYPGWRRGDGAKGSNHIPMKEPGGYRWQTTN